MRIETNGAAVAGMTASQRGRRHEAAASVAQPSAPAAEDAVDRVTLSGEVPPADDTEQPVTGEPSAAEVGLKVAVVRRLLERLTDKQFDSKALREFLHDATPGKSWQAPGQVRRVVAQAPRDALTYDYTRTQIDARTFSFAASGVISTKDGEEVDFAVSLSMSRVFMEQQAIHVERTGQPGQPLVVEFEGAAAELSTTAFALELRAADDAPSLVPGALPVRGYPAEAQDPAAGQQVDLAA